MNEPHNATAADYAGSDPNGPEPAYPLFEAQVIRRQIRVVLAGVTGMEPEEQVNRWMAALSMAQDGLAIAQGRVTDPSAYEAHQAAKVAAKAAYDQAFAAWLDAHGLGGNGSDDELPHHGNPLPGTAI